MLSAATSSPYPDNWFNNDDQFHHLYPAPIQSLAARHWMPLHITGRVAQYPAPAAHVAETAREIPGLQIKCDPI
jgi:hypothetical protein